MAFTHNGNFLVSGDDAGNVRAPAWHVWDGGKCVLWEGKGSGQR